MKKNYLLLALILLSNFIFSQVSLKKEGLQRKVLVEEFSTEACPNCPTVATYLAGIEHDNDNVILMVHHAGYYTDPFTIDESKELLEFYNDGGATYAPGAMVDRHYNGLDNDQYQGVDPGPVFWPASPNGETRINDRLTQPAFVDVNFEGTFNTETKELSITVKGTFQNDFTDNLGVSLWVIEDGLTTTDQAGASGEWTHHALIRDAISGTFGDAITTSTNKDDEYSVSFVYTINDNWLAENLSLIAFVNTMDDSDVNNRTVHNANAIELSELIVSINENPLNPIKMYPNPFNNEITINNLENASQIIVSNMLGQAISTIKVDEASEVISASELQNGIYMITVVDNNNNSRTVKVVKQ